jgi:putative membrane protein
MNRTLLGAIAAAFVAWATLGHATAAPMDDKMFITTVIGINLEEIQAGQLAQMKSQNAAVKAYGQTLVKDHTDANNQAKAIAMNLGVTVPTTLTPDAQKMMTSLMGLTGADFDKAFLTDMVTGHMKAIQMFTDQSASTNPAVAAFAKMSLPVLQMHLATAQMLLNSKS